MTPSRPIHAVSSIRSAVQSARVARSAATLAAVLLLAGAAPAGTLKVPADFATIQAAVDAAVPGDVIVVSKGVYAENVVVAVGGITLQGKNAVIDGRYAGSCLSVTGDGVTVTGFTLANGGSGILFAGAAGAAAAAGSAGSAGDAGPEDGGGPAVGGLHCIGTGAVIAKNDVRACGGFGIRLDGSGDVTQNDVAGCTATGIEVNGLLAPDAPLTTIGRNVVHLCGNGIIATLGAYLVEKNRCFGNDGVGISLDLSGLFATAGPGDGAGVPPSRVTGNGCEGNSDVGIAVLDVIGTGSLIEKNSCSGNGGGLTVLGRSLVVSANKITANRAGGLLLFLGLGTVTGNKLTGNGVAGALVASPNFAAAIGPGDGIPSGSNTITGNLFKDNGGDGLVLAQSPSSTVTGNTASGNLGDGLSLLAGSNDGIVVSDNTVLSNQHDGIDNSAGLAVLSGNVSRKNGGNDLAGTGDGTGTTDAGSTGNVFDTGGLDQPGLLDLATFIL